jgi:hypothetical protein
VILSSLSGVNGTVFMYGQTGSGKTFTMLGEFSKEFEADQQPLNKSASKRHGRSMTKYRSVNSFSRSKTPVKAPNNVTPIIRYFGNIKIRPYAHIPLVPLCHS